MICSQCQRPIESGESYTAVRTCDRNTYAFCRDCRIPLAERAFPPTIRSEVEGFLASFPGVVASEPP